MSSSQSSLAGLSPSTTANLVFNHDFADGVWCAASPEVLPGWVIRQSTSPGDVLYTLEEGSSPSGNRCVQISIPSVRLQVGRLAPSHLYPVSPASLVTITFWYRACSFASGSESAIWIELYDSRQVAMATSTAKRTVLPVGDGEWTLQTVQYQVPDDDPDGYHVGFFFRQINPGCLWVDQVSLTTTEGRGRFLVDAPNVTPPTIANAETKADDVDFALLFSNGEFVCEKNDLGTLQIFSAGETLRIRGSDGAVVNFLSHSAIHYPGHGQGGFFRDLFWLPEEARWNDDATGKYELQSCKVTSKGKLQAVFQRELQQAPLTGLKLRKKYIIDAGLRRLAAEITIVNQGREEVEIRYWSWHRLAMASEAAVFASQGDPEVSLATDSPSQVYFKPHFSQWVKVSDEHYFGWDRSRLLSGGAFLDRVHIWHAPDNPALGLVGKPVTLAGGGIFRTRIAYQAITERFTLPPPFTGDFRLAHPYEGNHRLVCRASLHNHCQFHPGYTHAPLPAATLLSAYRDHDCQPPYKIVSITDHSRLTLPENTDPVGVSEPPWGVSGILCVPGSELCIGHRHGTVAGDLFGEINCIGLPKDSPDPTDQKQFYHEQVIKGRPGEVFQHLKDAGVYVGLCHPNCQLDADGVERWPASGFNYDELDRIFGNPEKGIPPLQQVPMGLEIGNQGYDFTARTNFINAEQKWDDLLTRGYRLHGTCSDDTHGRPAFRGWIVMFMDEMTEENFMENLRKGNFYASQGPQITKIAVLGTRASSPHPHWERGLPARTRVPPSGNAIFQPAPACQQTVLIETDIPSKIEFIGGQGRVLQVSEEVCQAEYTVRGDEIYVRAKVTRDCPEVGPEVGGGVGFRRSAWTNPFYLE